MTAQLLSGRALAKTMKEALAVQVAALRAGGVAPTLAVLRLGDDKAAAGYARAIEKNCASVGVDFRAEVMDVDVTQAAAAAALQKLNDDANVHGIMILEPAPSQINMDSLVMQLKPEKDIDGVHPVNAGRLAAQRAPYFVPATPAGGIRLLEEAGVEFKGKNAVVVGRSDIVGKPMAMLLLHRHCTVTIAHSRTVDLPSLCRRADILCVAVGRPEMVTGEWIKPGAIVVDFGTTYTADGLKGDCEQESVAAVAGMLTPVPGGTGPVTNVMLMSNLLEAVTKGKN
ncbi:MAG: bifunctional 5,10-methylenetetrahydrofolate dehydrogenase/5,10-methenyltetrahydrofolate cyclohydrolase [Caldilineaceae bacterium]|nr:bifunctional 5,10-methylenetetrahydrofolate dehydrogenase/5,10-methenyltetrahydrofolate cyclohydrolase [Caldilineaceae bacterium]